MKFKDSLGVLEDICKKIVGIYGYFLKKLEKKCYIVVVVDNGIIEEGVLFCFIEYILIVFEVMLN